MRTTKQQPSVSGLSAQMREFIEIQQRTLEQWMQLVEERLFPSAETAHNNYPVPNSQTSATAVSEQVGGYGKTNSPSE